MRSVGPFVVLLTLAGCARGTVEATPPPATPVPATVPEPPAPVPPQPAVDLHHAVRVGDCDTVRAHPSLAVDDAERLALAWCDRAADPAGALAALEGLHEGLLGDWARRVRGEALLGLERPADALAALDGLTLPGESGLVVRLLRDRALVAAGRGLEARDDLRALLETPLADEARTVLADAARLRGDVDAAVVTYRKVWTDSVVGPWSDRAAEALAALGRPVPDHATAEGRALVDARVAALARANRHEDALALLLAAEADRGTPLEPARLARASFRARRYPEAIAAWRAAYGAPGVATGPAGDLFDYAVASLRAGDRPGSEALYRRVLALWPRDAKAEEATWKLAWVPYDARECAVAIPAFDRYVAAYPNGPQATSAQWFRGWCAWREGRRDEAVATWRRLVAAHPDTSLLPAVRYWTARAAGLAGDGDTERAGLEAVVRDAPVSGYAWLAAVRLGKRFPTRAGHVDPPWPDALATLPAVRRADALIEAGLTPWALEELRTIVGVADDTRDGALATAHALARAGDAKAAHRLAAPYCVDPWRGGDPIAQQACWARPAADVVTVAAGRYGLHPLLPYAIMHAESGMDPTVTSYAGARGLMQIMPFEGPRLQAEAYGHGVFDPDALYRASTNALLGTTLLGLNARALDGALDPDALPAVIASYNGGLDAVERWVDGLGGRPVPVDVFAEEVGYTQTRQYVRGVLGHLMAYLWVYGDPPPHEP